MVGGALLILIFLMVSRRKGSCFLHEISYTPLSAYATVTSASAEASVAYGNTELKIGKKLSGPPSSNKFGIVSTSQVTGAEKIGGSGGACGADDVATAKNG